MSFRLTKASRARIKCLLEVRSTSVIKSVRSPEEFVVSLQDPVGDVHRVLIDVVVDFGSGGTIVGLELMDPVLRTTGALVRNLETLERAGVISFSAQADVAYLSLSASRPVSQRLRPARLVIDERDALARIEVGLTETPDYPQ